LNCNSAFQNHANVGGGPKLVVGSLLEFEGKGGAVWEQSPLVNPKVQVHLGEVLRGQEVEGLVIDHASKCPIQRSLEAFDSGQPEIDGGVKLCRELAVGSGVVFTVEKVDLVE
jgi:hypothetical protein